MVAGLCPSQVEFCRDLDEAIVRSVTREFDRLLIEWPYLAWTESQLRAKVCGLRRILPVIILDTNGLIREHGKWIQESIEVAPANLPPDLETTTRSYGSEPWRRLLIGDGEKMQKIIEMIRIVARRRSTVLLLGETGTGKEAVARAIHEASDRNDRELVSVNCAAIPETLIEAELFGHTKGAYTGATGSRAGYFERASGSTLLLDEIGEMPLSVQTKLLRVLQEREVQRVGGGEPLKVNCRVIAASNANLTDDVRAKRFRADLFYRLSVVVLNLPPLRERIEDIPALVDHFIERVCRSEELPPYRVSPAALMKLAEHDWPGNVRELEHRVESAVVMGVGRRTLTAEDFPVIGSAKACAAVAATRPTDSIPCLPESGLDMEETMRRMERQLLSEALDRTNGNKARAAGLLGIKRTTLLYKARNLGFAVS
jgi:transcriptional regulator with GAF, ATPase, and Fis domain